MGSQLTSKPSGLDVCAGPKSLWAFTQIIISFNYPSLDTAHLYYLLLVNASQSYLHCFLFTLELKVMLLESLT